MLVVIRFVFPWAVFAIMEFRNYPLSYRFSQRSMALAFALMISQVGIIPLPQNAQVVVGVTIYLIAGISLCVSFYVIVRYPLLSLFEPSGGDQFMKYFASSGGRVYKILKIAALAAVLIVIISMLLDGKNNLQESLKLVYFVAMFGCLLFMTFIYKPASHPAVATFIRATLGVGLLVFPIFIPALIVGSIRYKRLLANASIDYG